MTTIVLILLGMGLSEALRAASRQITISRLRRRPGDECPLCLDSGRTSVTLILSPNGHEARGLYAIGFSHGRAQGVIVGRKEAEADCKARHGS